MDYDKSNNVRNILKFSLQLSLVFVVVYQICLVDANKICDYIFKQKKNIKSIIVVDTINVKTLH